MTREKIAGTGMRQGTHWRDRRRMVVCLSGLVAVALLAAACSSGSGTASSSTTAVSTTAVVKVATVPTYGHILTNSSGKPLYTLSESCTGSCASAWPALTVTRGTKPTAGAGVIGTLSAVMLADGKYQVTYNGLPVYTFVKDSPDHVTGQGIEGFSVVKLSGSPTPTASTTNSTY